MNFLILFFLFLKILCFVLLNLSNFGWNSITAICTFLLVVLAGIAAYFAGKTWKLEKRPVVHAVGTFIITTEIEDTGIFSEKLGRCETTNEFRDRLIIEENPTHTLQLINVGRGPAQNVTPSVRKNNQGEFLESICSHSFPLPANKGTQELRETLRVHGQCFKGGDVVPDGKDIELEFEADSDRKIAYFYIHYEDCKGKPYYTKVKIGKVKQVDPGDLNNQIQKKDAKMEVWKVMENSMNRIKFYEII